MIITTIQAYMSTRPEGHPDRARCIEFAAGLPSIGLHRAVAGSLVAYLPLVGTYDAARVANEAAATKVALDSDRVAEASAAFTKAFNSWVLKIDGANDKAGYATAALRSKLGDQPVSSFLEENDWDKVARMPTVFTHVDDVLSLLGTPETLQALKDATTALRAALADHDRSVAARAKTVVALVAADKAFDQNYGSLVRNIQRYDPNGYALDVPKFRRLRKVKVFQVDPTAPVIPAVLPAPADVADPPVSEDAQPAAE